MVRTIGRLTSLAVSRARKPGLYADGGGLYLQVSGAKGRSWLFRYMLRGDARAMGLGSAGDVSLATARATAREYRGELQVGIDPIEARKERQGKVRLAAAQSMTFAACAGAYIETHKAGWRNAKHTEQWKATLSTYAYPIFGALPVQQVNVGLVLKAVEPIWRTKTETASRLRARIEAILDWARVRGYREGENPARWKGNIESLLPPRSRVRKVKHHPALPYQEVGAFMVELRTQEGTAARALHFAILTAARTGEVIGAVPGEFDRDITIWTIPAGRTKNGREHRVPLSAPASAIVKDQVANSTGAFVFPGLKPSTHLTDSAMLMLLDRMGRGGITVHGFRSSFRDWVSDHTAYGSEVAEMALAHTIKSKVESAYRRGDLLEKRRLLMADWANYCSAPFVGGKVLPLRRASEGD
jgi:integrase